MTLPPSVLARGKKVIELAQAEQLFTAPVHPYTKALLSAIPRLQPGQKLERIPFDHAGFQPLGLREVGARHFAAV